MSGGLKQLSTRAWVINVFCVAALGRDIVLDARLGSFRNDHFPDLPPQRPPNQPAASDSEKKAPIRRRSPQDSCDPSDRARQPSEGMTSEVKHHTQSRCGGGVGRNGREELKD